MVLRASVLICIPFVLCLELAEFSVPESATLIGPRYT